MYLAQPSQPCTSADKAKNFLMPEDPVVAGVAPEKPSFEETEEVNSPKKRLLPRNKDQNLVSQWCQVLKMKKVRLLTSATL
jgi:hypothetical protein